MSDLTEKWKNGELEKGWYYIKVYGKVEVARLSKYNQFYNLPVSSGYVANKDIMEVLAPVPSYEEWQAKESNEDFLQQRISVLESENDKLKAQIAKLTEIVGVLPSNHSVGNLGYKIKNQRHEINNRLKEIDKLKDLLKECRDVAEFTKTIVNKHKWFDEVITKIDEVLK